MNKRYRIEVVRTSYCSKDFEIEAENAEMAKKVAMECAYDTDFSGSEFDCEYNVGQPEEIKEENNYIDREGKPYDTLNGWPAGGGLHKDCEFNADALYAYYVIKDREGIFNYLSNKRFSLAKCAPEFEVWVRGNTKIIFERYALPEKLWGYMHTELIK